MQLDSEVCFQIIPGGRDIDDGFVDSIPAASFSSCDTPFIYFSPTVKKKNKKKIKQKSFTNIFRFQN